MVTQIDDRPIEVLLVEDNPADARLAQDTIEQSRQQANITLAEDGEVALAILRKEGEYSSAPRPDLILLDLRMPRKDGTEVLAEINADEDLVSIPVMLLTGTEAEASLLESYSIPPSRYARKPLQLEQFNRVLGALGLFSRQPIQIPTESDTRQASASEGGGRRWWWPFG
jgi:CheY-like chemotaxis protein